MPDVTLDEWEKQSNKIPLWQFLKSVHRTTERVTVYVVVGSEWAEERKSGRHVHDFMLTENAFALAEDGKSSHELERMLKYYAYVPVWNATAQLREVPYWYSQKIVGPMVAACINVNCHYRDMRDAWYREQADIKREKRREYERKRKAKKEGG